MSDIKITIVTVCFNAVKTIEQTICSVLRQTYENIEYIVVDGGSSDGTVAVLGNYSDKICWISEPDYGIYDAMNKGIKMATGDYIQFIGADDCLIDSHVIEHIVGKMDIDADIVSAAEIIVEEDSKLEFFLGNERGQNLGLGQVPWIPHAAMLTKTSLMKKMLFNTKYKIAADYDFILKCFRDKNIKFQFVQIPIVYFSNGGVSSKRKAIAQKETEQILVELGYSFQKKNMFFSLVQKIKDFIKSLLKKMGVWTWVRCCFLGVSRHECGNKPCRWCEP